MTAITAIPGPRRRGFAGSDGPTARSLPGPIESGIESRGERDRIGRGHRTGEIPADPGAGGAVGGGARGDERGEVRETLVRVGVGEDAVRAAREDRCAQRLEIFAPRVAREDDLAGLPLAVVERAEEAWERGRRAVEISRESRKDGLGAVPILRIAGESGEPQEVHGRYGVRGGSRSVEGLARADDQSVVLLRRQEVASPRIRETPVHFALQLDGRSKIAGLEGRLAEVEHRFDEEGVIRGEARNLGDAVLLPVQEVSRGPAAREDAIGGPARRLSVAGLVEQAAGQRESGDRE